MNRLIYLAVFVPLIFSSLSLASPLSKEDFFAPPDFISAKISPNGKYIAMVVNDDTKRLVMIYDIAKSKIITKFGDHIIRPYQVSWANDERILVKLLVPYATDRVRRDAKRNDDFDINDYYMFGRVVSTDIKGKEFVALMNDERSAQTNRNLARIPHYLPNDDNHVLMTSFRKGRLTQYKVNVYTGESEFVIKGGRFTIAYINDEDGKVLYRYDYKRIAKTLEIYEYQGDNNWDLIDEIFFDEEDETKNKVDMRDLVGVKDKKLVYRKMNEETGFHELITIDKGKKSTLVSIKDTDIVGVITRGVNNEVMGYTTLKDTYRSQFFKSETQQKYDGAAKYFKDENFRFVNLTDDHSKAIILSWSMNNPATYFTYDLSNDEITQLYYPYSKLPAAKLASGVKVQYLARDKTLINSYVLLPPNYKGEQPIPLVVLPHGGPQSRDSMSYDDFAQFIATRGYLVIKPNFRGSSGYGKEFEEAGYKQWGGKMQEDLEDAVAFLIDEGLVDKSRICIVGASYGGYAALMGTVKTPDLYRCAVSINGVTHLPEQVEYDLDKLKSDKLKTYIKQSIGDLETDMNMLIAKSPALHAEKIKASILLIHGEEDDVVPYEQSEMMLDALEDNNARVRMVTLEDTGHYAFNYKEDIETIYQSVEVFLAEFFKTSQ